MVVGGRSVRKGGERGRGHAPLASCSLLPLLLLLLLLPLRFMVVPA